MIFLTIHAGETISSIDIQIVYERLSRKTRYEDIATYTLNFLS